MFSDLEYTYLKNIIDTYILQGDYTNYIAYTYTNISGTYSNDYYDFYVILSNSEIIANGYSFTIPGNSLKISVNSKSASRNATNGERIVFSEGEHSVSVDPYEFIYSNAKNSIFPNILAKQEYITKTNNDHNISYNLDKNEFYMIPVFMGLIIMMLFLKWCFPMKGGKKV